MITIYYPLVITIMPTDTAKRNGSVSKIAK